MVRCDFEPVAAPKKSVAVLSEPVLEASRGTKYRTVIEAIGGEAVTHELSSGPEGMTVSPDGEVTWDVPADFAGHDAKVLVTVRSGARQAFHSFQIEVLP